MNHGPWLGSISLVLICVGGCKDPPDGGPNGPGYRCIDEFQIVTDVHSINHLGFSAQNILDLAIGSHEAPLHWQPNQEGTGLGFGPESGESSINLDLSYTGGPIHLVLSKVEKTDDGRSAPPKSACPDRLNVPVLATIRSAQGALNEAFATDIAATMPQHITLGHELAFDSLGGSLHTIQQRDGSLKINSLEFSVGISPFGISGNLRVHQSWETDKRIEIYAHCLATFPQSEEYCQIAPIE